MNPSVVVVAADCSGRHVTDVITEFGVSGVPVVRDDDRVIGVISEADLLPGLRPGGGSPETVTAAELMTAPPVTVTAGAPVSAAAGLMQRHRVKRLPVLDDETGALVGIVTRRDLLRGTLRSDEAIARELLDELLINGLDAAETGIAAAVRDGVVTLSGTARRRRDALAAARIAATLDGVTAVVDAIRLPGTQQAELPGAVRG